MVFVNVHCPECDGLNVVKHGRLPNGEQRYRCKDSFLELEKHLSHYAFDAALGSIDKIVAVLVPPLSEERLM